MVSNSDAAAVSAAWKEMMQSKEDVRKKGENAKVAIRNIRRDANDAIKKEQKANEISEDEEKTLQDDIQKLTDTYIKKVDGMVDDKSKEIMTV